jgi:DNA-directed RNA polymerase subunit M/transcription elongation factor TFIIS
MENHGTAPAFSFAPCKFSRLFCPRCRDLIIAATRSQHVSTNEVRHWWACETCGYEFRTIVQWQSCPPESKSTKEETLPQSLQSQKDHGPDEISSGV